MQLYDAVVGPNTAKPVGEAISQKKYVRRQTDKEEQDVPHGYLPSSEELSIPSRSPLHKRIRCLVWLS